MRIALNLLYLIPGVVGGTETYARSLIHNLSKIDTDNEYLVFLNKLGADMDITPGDNFKRVVCPFVPLRRSVRYGWEQGILPFQIGRAKVDVVHSLGYVAPLAARARQVVSVHDLNFLSHEGWGTAQGRRVLRFFVERSVSRADHVITISEFSKRGIVDKLGVPAEKVSVTYLAPAHHLDTAQPSATPDYHPAAGIPYILAFSALPSHKNIARLVTAFDQIKDVIPHSLVVIGNLPGNADDRHALEARASDRILFTGYLPNAEVGGALKGASLFVLPSLYEGFGLPVIEAQRTGVPVTCSGVASLPEVAGSGALFFDPLSVPDIAAALKKCLLDADLRATLVTKGYANAARFSWETTARETLAVYEAVAALPRKAESAA